eukprot:Skav220126  [mRNA]  locus=scaffold731:202950:212282:+ [translate_table: standard]
MSCASFKTYLKSAEGESLPTSPGAKDFREPVVAAMPLAFPPRGARLLDLCTVFFFNASGYSQPFFMYVKLFRYESSHST